MDKNEFTRLRLPKVIVEVQRELQLPEGVVPIEIKYQKYFKKHIHLHKVGFPNHIAVHLTDLKVVIEDMKAVSLLRHIEHEPERFY